MQTLRLKERAVQPHPKPKVTQSAMRLGVRLVKFLRRVTVRSFANSARPMEPFTTHNTLDCHCYDSNVKPLKAAAGKPTESKKPYKKSGGNKGMAFMKSIFEAYVKSM